MPTMSVSGIDPRLRRDDVGEGGAGPRDSSPVTAAAVAAAAATATATATIVTAKAAQLARNET
jgi:hypothetical protein